ncbi:hypothetical protein [Pseudaestuariivita rosea]|uniref:hypothetical protein n=1 Tax=Pseudaestuariivita rosea TaxID=2763263 RepID=UPI001ABB2809|nr:hypothetical protein [Pseudaestuariivita rosea]
MFQEWGFLVGEIWGLLIAASVLGLVTGWIIWGYGAQEVLETETERLRADLDLSRMTEREQAEKIAMLRRQLDQSDDVATIAIAPTFDTGSKGASIKEPEKLNAPRNDKPDDLKKINGIGPKLEKLCNDMGIYHFDQIAGWGQAEVAWMDENLKGFSGRVSRDNWVEQAQKLI